jgi:hypothetical protein
MPELPNWNKAFVVQRDQILGCIPTGYEWMLRVVDLPEIDFERFQDEFNLQAIGIDENNFDSIAQAVQTKYPAVKIAHKDFQNGIEKGEFIKWLVEKGIPCLLSLALRPNGGWHIMPIIYIDDRVLRTIWSVEANGKVNLCEFTTDDIINRHTNWAGGKDVAWLDLSSGVEAEE